MKLINLVNIYYKMPVSFKSTTISFAFLATFVIFGGLSILVKGGLE